MWGFTGILGKLIHLEANVIVWYRVVIAFIALGIYMSIKGISFKVSSKKKLFQIAIVGVFVGAHWLTFYQSIQLSTALNKDYEPVRKMCTGCYTCIGKM